MRGLSERTAAFIWPDPDSAEWFVAVTSLWGKEKTIGFLKKLVAQEPVKQSRDLNLNRGFS
ncbi:MAG: hypothetical protein HY695_01090 [Deltaproteobacteria bacterium]|nr:hypothetical protein [Deltaproteobacteria bacterium]